MGSRPFSVGLALLGMAVNVPSLLALWFLLPLLVGCGLWLGHSWRSEHPWPEASPAMVFIMLVTLGLLLASLLVPRGAVGSLSWTLDLAEPPLSLVGNLALLLWALPDGPFRRARKLWADVAEKITLNRAILRGTEGSSQNACPREGVVSLQASAIEPRQHRPDGPAVAFAITDMIP